MNKLINNMLEKAAKNDDPFFQPKDILKREEKKERQRKEFPSKIKLGLQNIKVAYENRNWDSESEKLFLKTLSELHLNEPYYKSTEEYLLLNENDEIICFFNLKTDMFCASYDDIWDIFENKFYWNYNEIQSFIKDLLEKHFKLYEFTPMFFSYLTKIRLEKHLKLYGFTPKIVNYIIRNT